MQQEDINFLLTNRIPRRLRDALRRLAQPASSSRWCAISSIAVWRLFSDLDLSEAKKSSFTSLHDCFMRELKDGARPVDPDPAVLISPCDAIVGACGAIEDTRLIQIKGFGYTLDDLLLRSRAGRALPRRLLCDAAAHRRACITAFTPRMTAGSSG